jgi:hypothetical protein
VWRGGLGLLLPAVHGGWCATAGRRAQWRIPARGPRRLMKEQGGGRWRRAEAGRGGTAAGVARRRVPRRRVAGWLAADAGWLPSRAPVPCRMASAVPVVAGGSVPRWPPGGRGRTCRCACHHAPPCRPGRVGAGWRRSCAVSARSRGRGAPRAPAAAAGRCPARPDLRVAPRRRPRFTSLGLVVAPVAAPAPAPMAAPARAPTGAQAPRPAPCRAGRGAAGGAVRSPVPQAATANTIAGPRRPVSGSFPPSFGSFRRGRPDAGGARPPRIERPRGVSVPPAVRRGMREDGRGHSPRSRRVSPGRPRLKGPDSSSKGSCSEKPRLASGRARREGGGPAADDGRDRRVGRRPHQRARVRPRHALQRRQHVADARAHPGGFTPRSAPMAACPCHGVQQPLHRAAGRADPDGEVLVHREFGRQAEQRLAQDGRTRRRTRPCWGGRGGPHGGQADAHRVHHAAPAGVRQQQFAHRLLRAVAVPGTCRASSGSTAACPPPKEATEEVKTTARRRGRARQAGQHGQGAVQVHLEAEVESASAWALTTAARWTDDRASRAAPLPATAAGSDTSPPRLRTGKGAPGAGGGRRSNRVEGLDRPAADPAVAREAAAPAWRRGSRRRPGW